MDGRPMKNIDSRWSKPFWPVLVRRRHTSPAESEPLPTGGTTQKREPSWTSKNRISTAALAFRGYDVANLGRSAELLAHRVYGPLVHGVLNEASVLCSDALK